MAARRITSGVISSLSPNQNASTSARPMPALAISRISEPWRRSMAWRMAVPVESTADCEPGADSLRAEADEPERARPRHGVLARARVELVEQVLQVPLDRLVADVDRLGDLLVGEVARQQQQDAALLGRQRARALAALALLAGVLQADDRARSAGREVDLAAAPAQPHQRQRVVHLLERFLLVGLERLARVLVGACVVAGVGPALGQEGVQARGRLPALDAAAFDQRLLRV